MDYADIRESASASLENSESSRKRLQDKRNTMCYRNGKIPRVERRMEALISKSVNIDKNRCPKKSIREKKSRERKKKRQNNMNVSPYKTFYCEMRSAYDTQRKKNCNI